MVGALTMWVAAGALASASLVVLRAATQVALWCFVATVFAAVSHALMALSAGEHSLGWTASTVAWALRYGNWFVRPRIDGRPG